MLPDRLWNVVDAFDPLKLRANQPALVDAPRLANVRHQHPATPQRLAAAQQIAGVNRRLVTTDSYDLPVPSGNLLKRLVYGADGQPGVAGVDDDGDDGTIDDAAELGWYNSDDWYAVMYHEAAATQLRHIDGEPTPPSGVRLEPQNPTIVDLLHYRVQYERAQARRAALYRSATQRGHAATACPGNPRRPEDGPQSAVRRWTR